MLKEYNHYITYMADKRSITKINYRVDRVSKDATMRIERENKPLSLVVLKNLAKFEWIKTQAGKLSLPPPPELSAFRLSAAKKKRKRTSKLIKEVFVKEDIKVDGMYRNLIPPQGVVGSIGLVITSPESGIFFYNGNKGLAECKASASNLIGIQVKDIVKEVEDYLKTYSSSEMDIRWYVEGIL
uniref:Uncharacterized protein n=1 Tax=Tanacetum cinerariifolium TaxID=118510 RepID=A0A699JC61_TANCI|nr:hypothetical protein [Tanacetum cinerariifolium]